MHFFFCRLTFLIQNIMKFITTSVLMPVLTVLAVACTSTTALQTSETDDLYYSSASDKTVSREMGVPPVSSGTQTIAADEVANPEYSGTSAADQTAVTNNYNYYDNDYGYSRRSYRTRSYSTYSNYSYDPFYSPFGYSAAYCYNIYDPFWYPYCYPSGVSISIGVGFGYGYPYYAPYYNPYYQPYGYYGYGGYPYGGYHHGYDNYYGGGYGYGYGYGHRQVNYAPRTDRGNVPSGTSGGSGRPNPGREPIGATAPGRPMRESSTVPAGGRPGRTAAPQPGQTAPGRQEMPAGQPTVQPGVRPNRDVQSVQPQNYQFQEQPSTQPAPRPVRGRENQVPVNQGDQMNQNQAPPAQQVQPQEMPAAPQQPQGRPQPQRQYEQVQPTQPNRENYSRPSRDVRPNTNYNTPAPTYRNESPTNFGNGGRPERPSGGGRPRN
jgi:hypothetical protein